jgi:hypothetical protein
MSPNKYRKQKRRKASPWPLVALGGLLIAAAVFLFANQGGGGGTPAITVDQSLIDYGYVKYGETKQFRFQVTNTGDGALRFKEQPRVEVLEGC